MVFPEDVDVQPFGSEVMRRELKREGGDFSKDNEFIIRAKVKSDMDTTEEDIVRHDLATAFKTDYSNIDLNIKKRKLNNTV